MRNLFLPLTLLLLLGAGCFSLESETTADSDTGEQTQVVTEPSSVTGEPTEPPTGEPPDQQESGIQNHALFIAFSDDGDTWDVNEETIAEEASVGNLMALTQDAGEYEAGDLLAYFVDASEMAKIGEERIGLISSTDNGKTWSERQKIVINDLPDTILTVDPTAVQLDDGSIRIFFFDFSQVGGVAQEDWDEDQDHVILSAISTDGETFDFEGESFRRVNVTDPEVVKFGDMWFMYLAAMAEDGIAIATSVDGQSFEDTGIVINMEGIPGSLVVDDEVQIFGCSRTGITRASSTDGTTFSEEEIALQVPACDPDPAILADGSIALLFKGFSTTLTMPPAQ